MTGEISASHGARKGMRIRKDVSRLVGGRVAVPVAAVFLSVDGEGTVRRGRPPMVAYRLGEVVL